MNQPTTVGLIGAGRICEEHLRFLRSAPGVRIAGMCDLSPAMAEYMARDLEATPTFTEYERMLDDVSPNVVHILTPAHTHLPIIERCLDAGSHVIVEKPITTSREDFHRLWTLASDRDRLLIEDHNYRFNEPFLELEQHVQDGVLGEIREVEVRMTLAIRGAGGRYADANLPHPSHQLPAGVIHEFLTHLSYLALRLVPAAEHDLTEPRVRAAWSNHGGGDLFTYDDLDALVILDDVHIRLRFDCHTQPDSFTVTARGTRGTAHVDLFQPSVLLNIPRGGPSQLHGIVNQRRAGKDLKRAGRRNFFGKIMQKTPYEGLHTFLARTYDALHAGGERPVTYADMDRTLQLIEAVLDEANRV